MQCSVRAEAAISVPRRCSPSIDRHLIVTALLGSLCNSGVERRNAVHKPQFVVRAQVNRTDRTFASSAVTASRCTCSRRVVALYVQHVSLTVTPLSRAIGVELATSAACVGTTPDRSPRPSPGAPHRWDAGDPPNRTLAETASYRPDHAWPDQDRSRRRTHRCCESMR